MGRPSKPSKRRRKSTSKSRRGDKKTDGRPVHDSSGIGIQLLMQTVSSLRCISQVFPETHGHVSKINDVLRDVAATMLAPKQDKVEDGRPVRTRQLGMSVRGTSWYELPSGRVVQVSTLSEMERCQRTDKST